MARMRQRGSGAKSLAESGQEGSYSHAERIISSRLVRSIATNDKGLHEQIEIDKIRRKAKQEKHDRLGKGRQLQERRSYNCGLGRHRRCAAMNANATICPIRKVL